MTAGFQIDEPIHTGARSSVCRARRIGTGDHVVLKMDARDAFSRAALSRSQREFEIASPIRSEHVARYLDVVRCDEGVAVVEEAFGDRSLASLLAERRLGVTISLRLGAQIARGLAAIHAHDVTHRAIHPGNVVVDTKTWIAKIVDFAEAAVVNPDPDPTRRLDARAIPFQYISPEQTGRTNRTVDYRSDLYSLGATLYHALTGRPPFDLADPLALVHAHIALSPMPACAVDPRVPDQVSRIVDRLLAKNAEDRYQSARGVVADLEECLRQYRISSSVARFPLGRFDLTERLKIPEKLYGREPERAALLGAFADAEHGAKLLFLVSGDAGVGKSSLVRELQGPALDRGGVFVWGKFDPLHRHVPYFALGQALGQLCRGLLGKSEEDLAGWRARILGRVQSNAGFLVEWLPDLERVLGPQPAPPATGLLEAAHRFNLMLISFLSAFAGEGRPLVLWLDDLQWADPATLQAVVALLRAPEPTHVLVAGSYRDDDVQEGHPLSAALNELRGASVDVRALHLAGLGRDDVCALLADTLHAPRLELGELAGLVIDKTSGNPFFVGEFLRTLHDERLVRLAPDRAAWTWDIAGIAALAITPNVVDLMVRKLERLPPATQEAVRAAACVGNEFDLDAVANALGRTRGEMRADLGPASRDRLVVPLDEGYQYRFQHDHVRQAAYESLPAARRSELHRRLGRVLLTRADPEARGDAVFAIVDQLRLGRDRIVDPADRLELATLACEAGQRARGAAAYEDAFRYVRTGLAMLPADAWTVHYPLTSALHLAYVECAYRTSRLDEANAASKALLPRLRTELERAELYSIRIALETNRGAHRRAIELAREGLAGLGHPVPGTQTRAPLLAARMRLALAMRGRRVEDLARLPELTDPRITGVVKLLGEMLYPAYWADPKLTYWALHEILRLAIRYGINGDVAAGFETYAVVLIAAERDYARALAFGRLGLALAERQDAFAYRSRIHLVFGCLVNGYAVHHLRTSLSYIERAYRLGLESGDVLNTGQAAGALPFYTFLAGDPVEQVLREAEVREAAVRALGFGDMVLVVQVVRQAMRCLRGETRGPASMSTDALAESELVAGAHASSALVPRSFYDMVKVILLSLFGECREAVRMILAEDDVVETGARGSLGLTEYGFFACLALVEGLRDPELDARAIRRVLAKKRRLLAGWAKSAPGNFLHKEALVSAEVAELRGQRPKAAELYDLAIREANANGFRHHAAVASELAGRAYARRGLAQVAQAYFAAAREGYAAWGASAKVRALDDAHPDLQPKSRPSEPLDVVGVVRASHALSDEISLPALLERVMRVIAQTAGAQRAALFVEDGARLRTEASLDVERPGGGPSPGRPEAFGSEAIVRYVLRTGEDVVLADASRTGPFVRDPYIVAHGCRSVLCMAVRHRDRVTGALFLENDLSADAFTESRCEVLRVLVSQAAISLQNAGLFEKLQEEVEERRRAESAVRFLADAGAELAESLDYGATLAKVARLVVPVLADWCVIDVVEEDGARRVAAAHVDPAKTPLLDALCQRYPAKRGSTQPASHVLRSAEPFLVSDMTDDLLVKLSIDEEHRRLLRELGTRTVMSVPLIVREQTLGTMTFVRTAADRPYGPAELSLAVELARRAAVSIDNSRLYGDAQKAIRMRDDFLSVASHELRTPITSMTFAVQAFEAETPPVSAEKAAKLMAIVARQTRRLRGLVEDLLSVSRLELHRLAENPEPCDLAALAREVIDRMAEDVGRAGCAVSLRAERPVVGCWDRDRIDQVLVNLLSNARKFGPGRPIEVTVEEAGAEARLSVRDHGIGIAPEDVPRIFDRFGRAVSSRQYGGLGLGLYIVREIVRAHGGTVVVESAPGEGALFTVRLPLGRPSGEDSEATTPS